ncbi:hypothetical protein P7K49_026412 [Saguinus oedipus]|uniref:Uncharacterized protein n=1 Tax=Saguinus oedipus TaxID=9490 RepID=A0ABQ9UDD4_SAGOE|nr:hypothetical protein P7K49_026412 [Saguinus oedipus]
MNSGLVLLNLTHLWDSSVEVPSSLGAERPGMKTENRELLESPKPFLLVKLPKEMRSIEGQRQNPEQCCGILRRPRGKATRGSKGKRLKEDPRGKATRGSKGKRLQEDPRGKGYKRIQGEKATRGSKGERLQENPEGKRRATRKKLCS